MGPVGAAEGCLVSANQSVFPKSRRQSRRPWRAMGPVGAAEGCLVSANQSDQLTTNFVTITSTGPHPGTVEFFHSGTTAQFAISTSPHWAILIKGPVKVNGKRCEYVLLDHYVDAIRYQGNDDKEELMAKGGVPASSGGIPRQMGPEGVIMPNMIPLLHSPEVLSMFFKPDNTLKPFNMSHEDTPDAATIQAAEQLLRDGLEVKGPPADRKPVASFFCGYRHMTSTNCKRFALVVGHQFGLALPPLIQAVAHHTLKEKEKLIQASAASPEVTGRALEAFVDQGRGRHPPLQMQQQPNGIGHEARTQCAATVQTPVTAGIVGVG